MVTRTISSSGTMTANLVNGQPVEWTSAVPCWRSSGWYSPTQDDINKGIVWIWSSYWMTQEEAEKGAIRIFRKTFDLRGTGTITSAKMSVAVDNKVTVIINGDIVREVEGFASLTAPLEVKPSLIPEAVNELKFIVINRGGPLRIWPLATPEANPAGLIYKLEITTQH